MPNDVTDASRRRKAREENRARKEVAKLMAEEIAALQHQAGVAVQKAMGTYEIPRYH